MQNQSTTDVADIFKIAADSFNTLDPIEADSFTGSVDTVQIISKSKLVQSFFAQPAVAQVVTNYGARYKKAEGFADEGKIQQTLKVKQGKEQTDKFMS